MFSYIKGLLSEKSHDYVVIENNGIGYFINTSLSTIQELGALNTEVKVYTHLHVREDNISLFGFLTLEEMRMFHLLTSVSGIGPKVGLAIMSGISPSKFSLLVITDDFMSLTKIQGVGKKIAQRIILELKDKLKKETLENTLNLNEISSEAENQVDDFKEAIDALIVLGYSKDNAYNAVKKHFVEGIDIETLIKNSLKSLAR